MYTIVALYKFTPIPDPAACRAMLETGCRDAGIVGTLLVAPEGINGTIAGPEPAIRAALAVIRAIPGCEDIEWKESQSTERPFRRLKVRVKREIVTLGQPQVDPRAATGQYVDPSDWNALIAAPDVAVIDTRNDYEVAIGSFRGAVDPETQSFGDFPSWWAENQHRFQGKRIAMFCTGGIRCEKSTNYLRGEGVEQVYHLKGGILKYLEDVPAEDSLWDGACFVFDERVSVTHRLEVGPHVLCHGCRRPLLPADRERPEYEPGVSCHFCFDETDAVVKERFRERQRQIALARERGETHLAKD